MWGGCFRRLRWRQLNFSENRNKRCNQSKYMLRKTTRIMSKYFYSLPTSPSSTVFLKFPIETWHQIKKREKAWVDKTITYLEIIKTQPFPHNGKLAADLYYEVHCPCGLQDRFFFVTCCFLGGLHHRAIGLSLQQCRNVLGNQLDDQAWIIWN